MSKFTFGNFEAEFDPTDIHFVEKYEAAAENFQKKVKTIVTQSKASQTLKSLCDAFFEAFDNIFTEGASKKMFSEALSLNLCVKAFKELVSIMNDHGSILKELTGNRAARRTKKK